MPTWKLNTPLLSTLRCLCLLCLFLAPVAFDAHAATPRGRAEPGLVGDVTVMAGVLHAQKSLSQVSDENKRIHSLDQASSSETEFIPMPLWHLAYTFENLKTGLYAGTPASNIVQGTYFLEVGARHRLGSGTTLSLSWIPELPLIDDEVWKDPFVLGRDRQETERTAQGFQIKAESLWGSPFFLTYALGINDIEEEESGQAFRNEDGAPLSDSERKALRRSSQAHLIETGLRTPVSRSLILGTTLELLRNEADGKAHRFSDVGAKVSVVFRHPLCQAFSSLAFHRAHYDGTHPVFDEKREDQAFSASLGLEAPLPVKRINLAFSLLVRYARTDSNIAFYEGDTAMAGMGVSYRF